MKISVDTVIHASSITEIWNTWTTPENITRWNFAMEEWCCPRAENDLSVGGKFNYRMEANDGSAGFNFEGVYTEIIPHTLLRYKLEDNREVSVEFIEMKNGVRVVESIEIEDENSAEQQRQGWLGILNNFKRHVERKN